MYIIISIFAIVIGIFFSPTILYAQEIETTIDLDTLWEIAKTKDAMVLPTDQQLELMKILNKEPNFLNDIKKAGKTCDALKHYGDLDKNTDCKNWYKTEWKFWKTLNK